MPSTRISFVECLLDRIRPLVSEDALEQAKQLCTITLAQQKLWYHGTFLGVMITLTSPLHYVRFLITSAV